jgi:hypothetical protein
MYRFRPTAILPLPGFMPSSRAVARVTARAGQAPPKRRRASPVRPSTSCWVLPAVLAYGPLLLLLDSRVPAAWPGQYLLGAVTLAVLWLCTRTLDAADRGLVWMCVIVATGFEILGSLVWGAYRYRFGGIPFFVPFGHGLLYVFGARLAATSWVRRHEELFTRGILVVAAVWAIGGLTLLPPWTARHDIHGLVWLPVFAYVLLCSPRKAFFAALFIATTDIELAGTWFCNWIWAPTTPWLHVASGNPPSAIAGGYAIIDGSMLQLAALISRLREVHSRGRSRTLPFASLPFALLQNRFRFGAR